uniref:Uncharacterized protein n=1 Tax=Schistosoma curassoni TaxID=6186 RepID=A0A183JH99_9TREM
MSRCQFKSFISRSRSSSLSVSYSTKPTPPAARLASLNPEN